VLASGQAEPEARLVQTAIERRLDELRGPDPAEDGEFLSELINLFLTEAPAFLAALAAAVEGDDAATVEERAHSLKGAAGNLGAARLAALCGELEAAGRGHRLDSAGPLIGRLQAELDQVRNALDAVLASL
jgi:HPt (histidine-containing phosphotransfer) domain-containing protein